MNIFQIQNHRIIQVPQWDDQTKQKTITYWQERGVIFHELTDTRLSGHRGSLWGNLTSYDMSKLRVELTISQIEPNTISCLLDVDTSFQDITEWNKAYWELEMATLESYLLHEDLKEVEWQQFRADSRAAAWLWSLSFRWLGQKLPRKP